MACSNFKNKTSSKNASIDLNTFTIEFHFLGTVKAGSKKAILNASLKFYKLHDKWLDQGRFVGKDQNLMNVLTFGSNTEKTIVRLKTTDLDCSKAYNVWFFYQTYFARPSEYICKNDRLSLLNF